jgi:anti-sigma regulatory factor (Ser/Thr protein kinase)
MMASLTTYSATCWREETSWLVRVAELERTTQAARLSEVEAAARHLIGSVTGVEPETVDVVVDLRVPDGIRRLLDAAAAAREEADLMSPEAVTLRRTLAHRLTDHGYGVRDIAVLLGVSYPRAKQLADDPPEVSAIEQAFTRPALQSAPKAHSSYQHEALFYRNDEEFLAGTVPFLQDAVTLGQPIMVALNRPRLQMFQAALKISAQDLALGDVDFVDMAQLGANPARIIPAWLDFVQAHQGKPVRGIGEPQWPGRRPEEVVECQLHEGLLNVAIDPDTPLWLRCPYDAAALSPAISEAAMCSHPAVVRSGHYRGSTSYGGLDHVDSIFRSALPPAPADSVVVEFGADDLSAVRAEVTRSGPAAGLDPERTRALADAVEQIATNSVRHGGGRGQLRTWTQPGAVVCQVSDPGRLEDPLVGRRTPPTLEEQGRGLWMAHQISDLVQIRCTVEGTSVRVFAWL